MKRIKSHIKITVSIGKDTTSFNLSPVGIVPRKYWVKHGKSAPEKMPMASLTQVFNELRKWVVARETSST